MKQLTMGSKIRLATYVPGPPDGQECLAIVVDCHGSGGHKGHNIRYRAMHNLPSCGGPISYLSDIC